MCQIQNEYKRKLVSTHDALSVIHDDERIAIGMANSQPLALIEALRDLVLCSRLAGVSVYYQHGTHEMASTLLSPELADLIKCYCFFLSHHDRAEINSVRFIPSLFNQTAKLLLEDIKVTTLLVTVSAMSEDGFFSFGCGADYVMDLIKDNTIKVIVEVNNCMPYVQGQTRLHISQVTGIVENHHSLMQAKPREATEKDRRIARFISDHISDGCTIQLGIGGVPSAVAEILCDYNDLGIHTELLSPALVNLVRNGNANGYRKSLLPREHVFTLALGDDTMYDYMRQNQQFSGYPVSWTNDPSIISRNDNMISVNAAVEVDLFGQVNAEMINGRHYSGTGGQLDFVRGAYASKGGKSFIALYSTAKNDTISKIVMPNQLSCVTDPRTDVQYIVTEHGIVNLKGLSIDERTDALVEIAHPKFREELKSQKQSIKIAA